MTTAETSKDSTDKRLRSVSNNNSKQEEGGINIQIIIFYLSVPLVSVSVLGYFIVGH